LRKRKVVAITEEEAAAAADTSPRPVPVRREAVLFHPSIPCRCEISAAAE
jgi:hypothetical protein